MKLQFTKQAREEFLRIVSVFAEYAGLRSADKFIKRVNDRGETLLNLIYYVTKTTIWIVDIWDRRNDPAKLVKRIR